MRLCLELDGETMRGVALAATGRQRLRGLIGRDWHGLVLRGSRVHGWFMSRELAIVGIDTAGIVIGTRRLLPWRWVSVPGAAWIVESTDVRLSPTPGTSVTVALHKLC